MCHSGCSFAGPLPAALPLCLLTTEVGAGCVVASAVWTDMCLCARILVLGLGASLSSEADDVSPVSHLAMLAAVLMIVGSVCPEYSGAVQDLFRQALHVGDVWSEVLPLPCLLASVLL